MSDQSGAFYGHCGAIETANQWHHGIAVWRLLAETTGMETSMIRQKLVGRVCWLLAVVVAQVWVNPVSATEAQKDRLAMASAALTFTATGGSAPVRIRFLGGPVDRGQYGTVPVLDLSGEWVSADRLDKALSVKPLAASTNGVAPLAVGYDELSDTGGRILADGELMGADGQGDLHGVSLKAEAHLRDSEQRLGLNAVSIASYEQKFVLPPGVTVEFSMSYSGAYLLDGVARGQNGMAKISIMLSGGPGGKKPDESDPVEDSRWTSIDYAGSFSGVLKRVVSNKTRADVVRSISVVLYAEAYNFQVMNPGMKAPTGPDMRSAGE